MQFILALKQETYRRWSIRTRTIDTECSWFKPLQINLDVNVELIVWTLAATVGDIMPTANTSEKYVTLNYNICPFSATTGADRCLWAAGNVSTLTCDAKKDVKTIRCFQSCKCVHSVCFCYAFKFIHMKWHNDWKLLENLQAKVGKKRRFHDKVH